MLARSTFATLIVLVLARPGAADDAITGFVAPSGQLSGWVTDRSDKPLAGVVVHVISKAGIDQKVSTDSAGRYHAEIAGGDAYVFAEGGVRIRGQVAVAGATGSNEIIEIREALAPQVMPKPITSPGLIPEYSDAASNADTWSRAWLLLEIGENGAVTHLKLLNKPGLDLDAIAIREGFKLKFEPARDRSNRPTRALLLWTFEWPSPWWMNAHELPLDRLPQAVLRMPCKIEGSTRSHNRDCSKPNLVHAATLPWIDKP
jgi:hypothetical protein